MEEKRNKGGNKYSMDGKEELTEGNGEVEDDGHKVAKAEGAVLPHVPDHHHHYHVPNY